MDDDPGGQLDDQGARECRARQRRCRMAETDELVSVRYMVDDVEAPGGKQVLVVDPSGNFIGPFQPA